MGWNLNLATYNNKLLKNDFCQRKILADRVREIERILIKNVRINQHFMIVTKYVVSTVSTI